MAIDYDDYCDPNVLSDPEELRLAKTAPLKLALKLHEELAALKRTLPGKHKHEPLFDLALELHDEVVAQHEHYVKELDTLTDMTEDHEQQALFVEASLRTVRQETLKLMDLTREDS
jgi:hypothetical protein